MNDKILDLAIIGGGPAGLTAGMYATRGGLSNVIMFERAMIGGQITSSSEIENYPGALKVVTGLELMEDWPKQSTRFGLKIEQLNVSRISKNQENLFLITVENGAVYKAKTVIVCTGSAPKRAGVEGEDKFFGRGVSVCATCDGFFYKNKEIVVLGGGDTALEEALYLTNLVSKVYLIHRRDSFRAAPSTVQRVRENSKIELVLDSEVKEIYGDNSGVNGVIVVDKNSKETRDIKVPGIFVFVGTNVNNETLIQEDGEFLSQMSKDGEVVVDLEMKTSVAGFFAAGDIRIKAPKQVVCAAGDGAIAALSAISYIESTH